jgi:hypothetical protein
MSDFKSDEKLYYVYVVSVLKAEKRCKLFVEVVHIGSKKFFECEEMFFVFSTTELQRL